MLSFAVVFAAIIQISYGYSGCGYWEDIYWYGSVATTYKFTGAIVRHESDYLGVSKDQSPDEDIPNIPRVIFLDSQVEAFPSNPSPSQT
jgi:hypothetical protein